MLLLHLRFAACVIQLRKYEDIKDDAFIKPGADRFKTEDSTTSDFYCS
jgi:hypothetical protein